MVDLVVTKLLVFVAAFAAHVGVECLPVESTGPQTTDFDPEGSSHSNAHVQVVSNPIVERHVRSDSWKNSRF